MSELPEPLVPADVDLRDFLFTPVEFGRLFASETWVMSNDAEKVAAITLWGKSWSELPAGSMPAEDRMLAHLSGAGSKWKRVKPMAMRGWVLCSDGRYYHPVMCEKALEAWLEKLGQRISSGSGNQKRWGTHFDPRSIAAEYFRCRDMLAALNPGSRSIAKPIPTVVQKAMTGSPNGNANGNPDGTKENIPTGSQGTGTGTGTNKTNTTQAAGDSSDQHDDGLIGAARDWYPNPTHLAADLARAGIPQPDPERLQAMLADFRDWFANKPMTDSQFAMKFRDWIRRDRHDQRPQARAGAAAGRKLTPVEQAELDKAEFLRQHGIEP